MTIADRRLFFGGLLIAALVFAVDQAVKAAFLYWAGFVNCAPCPVGIAPCVPCAPTEVLPFLNFVMVWNPGVSFGMFPADSAVERWGLIVFSLLVSAGLAVWLARIHQVLLALAIALVIGGALGNVIDRILFGAVADFFHFHAFGYSWYVFNIADAAIVIGVAIMIADAFLPDAGARAAGSRSDRQ